MSAAELNKLPKEQVDKLPMIEVFVKGMEAETSAKPRAVIVRAWMLVIENLLYDLRFYPHLPKGMENPDLAQAVRDFQRSIRAPETGVLLVGEYAQLARNVVIARVPDFSPLGGNNKLPSVTQVSGQYASAQGTWTINNEKIAFLINTVEITCSKSDGLCRQASADVHIPEENLGGDMYYLAIATEKFTITKWEGDDITAETASDCRLVTLTINAASSEIYQIVRNRSGKNCTMPRLDKLRIATLVGGLAVRMSFGQERQKAPEGVYAPTYREMMGMIKEGFTK